MKMLPRCVAALMLLLFCSNAPAQAQNPFFVPPSYPGGGPIATADFNRDGKPDLVSADGTVMLGKGDGTFTVGTPLTVSGQSLSNVRVVATADFNGDGRADVLLSSSTNLYVFLGNGDGTFQPAITSNIGTPLGSVVVADVNGDGKPDVLGIIPGTAVFVLLGKGDGTFAPGVIYPLLNNSINLLTVGDFNGDGKPDIALAASGTNATGPVGVLLGKGDGTFLPVITSTAGIGTPTDIAAADFNGDGKLDLAISDSDSHETFLLLGNGNGTFQAPSSPLPAAGLLAAVDLNKDGKVDLFVTGRPFSEVFLGKGDGTFTAKGTYLGNTTNSGTSVVTADFNGDGKVDVATAGTMLLGNGDGTLQGNAAISLHNSGFQLFRAVTGDFNHDGSADIAVVTTNNANDLYILLNDGTGKFSLAHTYTLPLPFDAIATADVNGDSKLDLVFITHDPITQDWILNVMLGNGDGSFATPTTFPQGVPGPVTSVVFADFNGDHKPDLAVISGGQLTVFLGNGDGTFAAPVSFFAGSGPTSFAIADFNNDGIPDVAVSSSAGLGVLLGKGHGTFQPATFPVSGITQVIAAADLNGDGKTDLIVSASVGGVLQVLLGNGDGTFDALPPTDQTSSNFMGVADVKGDGKLDLLTSPAVRVLLGNGDGTFGSPIVVLGSCSNISCFIGFLLVADFNGDKRPDIAVDVEGAPGPDGFATLLNISGPPAPDFLIAASPVSPGIVAPGASAGSTVTLTAVGGFSGTVTLSCTGLPSGANCSFAPSSLSGGSGTSTLTISTASSTPVGTYPVLIVGTSTNLVHERVVTLTVATSAGATTANLQPEALTFAQQATGQTSSPQMVQMTNTGTAQLVISGFSVTGSNAGDFAQTNNCGATLAAGASCQISVTFAPTGVGGRSAALSVSDNATGSPQLVALAGTGPDFSMTAGSTGTATLTSGQTASYTLSIAPTAGFNQSVALTCSGAPAMSMCTVSPSTVSLNGTAAATAMVTVTTAHALVLPFGTGGPARRMDRPVPFVVVPLGTLALLVVSLLLWQRERRFRWVPVFALAFLVYLGLTLTSCGGGSGSSGGGGGGGGSTGTPAGTYALTVSGSFTSGSTTVTHATKLTLVVQ